MKRNWILIVPMFFHMLVFNCKKKERNSENPVEVDSTDEAQNSEITRDPEVILHCSSSSNENFAFEIRKAVDISMFPATASYRNDGDKKKNLACQYEPTKYENLLWICFDKTDFSDSSLYTEIKLQSGKIVGEYLAFTRFGSGGRSQLIHLLACEEWATVTSN